MIRLALDIPAQQHAAGMLFDLHPERTRRMADTHGLTRTAFIDWALALFSFYVVSLDGAECGVIAIGRGRIHVAVSPEAKGRWLRDLERVLRHYLGDDDEFFATVDCGDSEANDFVRRCGCILLATDKRVNTYLIRLQDLWFNRRHHGRNR